MVKGLGYEELRAAERAILVQAMAGIRARRLATPDFSWWKHITELIALDAAVRNQLSEEDVAAREVMQAGE